MRGTTKKKLLAIHSWVGLKLSLLMFIVCVTGTLAVVSYELDWLANSDLRVDVPKNAEIDWDAIHREVKLAYPQSSGVGISAPLYSNFASIVTINDPEKGALRVFVNPYTGKVQGDAAYYASFQRVLRDLHRYLLAPAGGIYLVGPLGVILLISTITALFFYKRWWQGFFKLRLNAGPRAFWGSLHKVSGLWSLWFLLLIGITGTWYLIEGIIADTGNRIFHRQPEITMEDVVERPVFMNHIHLSEAITIAKSQFEQFTPSGVGTPSSQNSPIFVSGFTDVVLTRERANGVFIDPVSGEVLEVRRTEDVSAMLNWVDMADPLHFGNFGGLPVKLIWFFFGILICLMSASGVVIFVKRIQDRQEHGWVRTILGGMRYLTFILLLIPVIFGTIITLFSMNKIGVMQHESEVSLKTNSDQHNIPPARLYFAKDDDQDAIRIGFDCFACIPKKNTLSLVLNDGESHRFRSRILAFSGEPSVYLPAGKRSEISHVEMQVKDGESIKLYLSN